MPTNTLSADNATFETSTGDWQLNGFGTQSRVTTPTPHAGSYALSHTIFDSSEFPFDLSDAFETGYLVTASAWVRQAGSGTNPWRLMLSTHVDGDFAVIDAIVPTTSWQRIGKAFIIGGGILGTDHVKIAFSPPGPYTSGDIGYLSDVLLGSERVNPPTGLTVTNNAGNAELNWAFGADQWFGFLDDPAQPQTLVRLQCTTQIQRSTGGSFSTVATVSGSTVTWTDTSAAVGYSYRLQQAIYKDTAGVGTIRGFSANSNTVIFTVGGGWGIGPIRMGPN